MRERERERGGGRETDRDRDRERQTSHDSDVQCETKETRHGKAELLKQSLTSKACPPFSLHFPFTQHNSFDTVHVITNIRQAAKKPMCTLCLIAQTIAWLQN